MLNFQQLKTTKCYGVTALRCYGVMSFPDFGGSSAI
jgi:hypothetical protein